MTIAGERQKLRALALQPIRQLPAYSADHTAAYRVGTLMAAHTIGMINPTYRWELERTLSGTALRSIFSGVI